MSADRRERERRGRVDYEAIAKKNAQSGGTSVRLPENCEWLETQEGEMSVDFMPFLASETVRNPEADPGYEICVRKYVVHRIPGQDGKPRPYCCLDECFGESCPACLAIGSGKLSPDQTDQLKKQTRRLFLINDHPGELSNPPGTAKNPWKVFDTVHWNRKRGFGEMLEKEIMLNPKYRAHDDLQNGYTARLRFEKSPNGRGGTWNECVRIDFGKRDYSYPDDLVYSAPCLDEALVKLSAEEMQRIIDGGFMHDEGAAGEEPPPRARENARRREPEAPARGDNGHSAPRPYEDARPREERRGEVREDRPPARREEKREEPRPRGKTLEDAGLREGGMCLWDDDGEEKEMQILRQDADGTLRLEDGDGRVTKGVPLAEVRPWKGKPVQKEPPRPAERGEDDDILEDDEDDEPKPKPRARSYSEGDEDDDTPRRAMSRR